MFTGFRMLAKLKGLRGTGLDLFGRTEERRTERALIAEYKASVEELLASLNAENHALALDIARLPEQIKGFGHGQERHLAAALIRWHGLVPQGRAGPPTAASPGAAGRRAPAGKPRSAGRGVMCWFIAQASVPACRRMCRWPA